LNTKETGKFKKWVDRVKPKRGLICHFYIPESEKLYYDKLDYAFFNLYSSSKEWIVKGTFGHGIRSRRGKTSRIPCLNFFEVNSSFIDALNELNSTEDHKFHFGIILNKRFMQKYFKKVIDVSTEMPNPLPPPNQCHHFDSPRYRYGVLKPFHRCKVVRIEIPNSDLRSIPISSIPGKAVLGILVKPEDAFAVIKLLNCKKLGELPVFPVL